MTDDAVPAPPPVAQEQLQQWDGGECIEVAELHSSVGLRDSKQRNGPHISVARSSWSAFVSSLRRG